jgi:predicted transcriptional regulator
MKEVNIAWTPLTDILYSLQQHNIIEVIDAVRFKDKRTSVHYNLTTKGFNVYKYLRNTKNNINEILSMLS